MTTYFVNLVLNIIFRATGSMQSYFYIAMFTNLPTTDGSTAPVEITIGATPYDYARLVLPRSTTAITAPSDGTVTNASAMQYNPAATSYPAPIQSIGIFDNTSGGNLLMVSALTTAKTIEQGDYGFFNAGGIQFTMS